jgi:hypothetical protein
MGNGIYGDNQGDESRAAGKGNGAVLMAERIADNEVCEGDVVEKIAFFWNCGAFDSLDDYMASLRRDWLVGVDPDDTDYISRVEGRLQSVLTRGTVGEPATQRVNLKEGANIPASAARGKNGKVRAPDPAFAGARVRVVVEKKPRKISRKAILKGVKTGEYTPEQAAELLANAN